MDEERPLLEERDLALPGLRQRPRQGGGGFLEALQPDLSPAHGSEGAHMDGDVA
jgi:hypothetical protein